MTAAVDYAAIRASMAQLPSDHDASGSHRPTASEIYAPRQHAYALDPNTPIVMGARGTGKSFWAGVLQQEDTRRIAAAAYPHIGLESLLVEPGYTGIDADGGVTARVVDARVKPGMEAQDAFAFWQAVFLRAAWRAANSDRTPPTLRSVMEEFADPEDAEQELARLDAHFASLKRTVVVTFDALDTLSMEWKRSRLLLDALFAVVWSMRARRYIRGKIFIRPEQLNDETLKFVELPKLRSMRIELEWSKTDLYGMLFSQLLNLSADSTRRSLELLADEVDAPVPSADRSRPRNWSLVSDGMAQQRMMTRIAGLYMGRSVKKGGTYDWPYNHLGDANGRVTPRSFMKLFAEAGKFAHSIVDQVISADGIRHGLREASRVRVDQLALEYRWIKRALAPLAGVTVPCSPDLIYARWSDTNTIEIILKAAKSPDGGFLPPFPRGGGDPLEELALAMGNIGVLSIRPDGRIDMPDLFRVAALMLKRGGTTPYRNK